MHEDKIRMLQEEMKKIQEQIEALQKEEQKEDGAEEVLTAETEALPEEDEMQYLTIPADRATVEVLESIETSTDDNDIKVETLCRWAAARAGVIVVAPLLGTVALMANEVYLVSRIAKVYNVKLSERALAAFLGAVGGHVAGNLLATLIPISVVQIPIAVGVTYSVGKVAQRWMKDGMPSDMQPYLEMLGEWREKAKEQVDKLKDNPLKDIPLGDETKDVLRNVSEKMKVAFEDAKTKSKDVLETVKQKRTSVEAQVEEELAEAKAQCTVSSDEAETNEGGAAAAETAEEICEAESAPAPEAVESEAADKVKQAITDAEEAVKEEKEQQEK